MPKCHCIYVSIHSSKSVSFHGRVFARYKLYVSMKIYINRKKSTFVYGLSEKNVDAQHDIYRGTRDAVLFL